jgi:hypothetical protein
VLFYVSITLFTLSVNQSKIHGRMNSIAVSSMQTP